MLHSATLLHKCCTHSSYKGWENGDAGELLLYILTSAFNFSSFINFGLLVLNLAHREAFMILFPGWTESDSCVSFLKSQGPRTEQAPKTYSILKTQNILSQEQAAVCRHLDPYLEKKTYFFKRSSLQKSLLLTTYMTFSTITQNSLAPYSYSFSNTFSNYNLWFRFA